MIPDYRRLALVALALLLPPAGRAQQGATVSGGVTDAATGAQLSGVTVQVGDSLSAETDAKGQFGLNAVPPRTYGVRLSHPGYRSKALSLEVRKSDRRVYLAAARGSPSASRTCCGPFPACGSPTIAADKRSFRFTWGLHPCAAAHRPSISTVDGREASSVWTSWCTPAALRD